MDLQVCYNASEDTFPLTATLQGTSMARLGFLHLPTPVAHISAPTL